MGVHLHFDTPPSYDNEVIVTTSYSATKTMASTKSMSLHSLNELNNNVETMGQKEVALKTQQRELMFGIPINSSQESSFEGFGASPFDKLQRLFYSNPTPANPTPPASTQLTVENKQHAQKASPGKVLFSKFYDTIVEENSCNAVDLQMSKDSGNCSLTTRRTSIESHNSSNSDLNPSSELSFNGKIKSLNAQQETQVNSTMTAQPLVSRRMSNLMDTSLNTSQQFSESFILKKYSNEKSPDLFGDDEEDEEEEDHDHHEEDEDQTQNLKTIPEHSTVLNESQMALSTCNLADNSFNCPTESSFANDDHTMDCSLTQGSCFGGSGNSTDSYTLFKDNCRREREMLRRIRKCLAGILPPPSVTIPQLDMVNAVLTKKNDIFNFINEVKEEAAKQQAGVSGSSTLSRVQF